MFTDISDRIHSLLWCDSGRPPPRCKEKRIENDLCFESRRLRKHSIVRRIEEKTFSTPDGVTLHVRVIKGAPGSPLALLASPLGFEDTSIFWPLIDHFGKRYTFVNWSYRGLFSSGMPRRSRKISIRDHANDAADVIKACGFENAEVVIGHSMGVQVALEFVLCYPEMVNSLILINGAYGNIFNTAFQPVIRLPFVGNISEWIIRTMLKYNPQKIMQFVVGILSWGPIEKLLYKAGSAGGSQVLVDISGEGFINEWIDMYFGGLARDEQSARNYCRLFQELHSHDVAHLLETIEQPTLLISGFLDYLTPYYLSKEMARQMPNCRHVCDPWSTHMTLMENPELVIEEAENFLIKEGSFVSKYIRKNSVRFEVKAEYIDN